LAAAALVVGAVAAEATGLGPGSDLKFVRLLLGGGALLVVAAIAAVFRVLGARFFRD
jgi:hypothetical protein